MNKRKHTRVIMTAVHSGIRKGTPLAGQSKAVCPDESDQNGNYKGSNIKCHIIFAEDSGIGIKQHRDQESAGENAGRQC